MTLSESEQLVLAMSLDALDRCIEAWVQGQALTDDEGRDFTAALMAANRIIHPDARHVLRALEKEAGR